MSLRERAKILLETERVKRLVRAHLNAAGPCIISVQETICTDPACPGTTTDIRVVDLSFHELRAVIHKGLSEITDVDIAGAF